MRSKDGGRSPPSDFLVAPVPRRRGAHRAPAPRAAAPLPPSLREVARRSRDGRSPRAAARVSIRFAAKSKCQHGGLRAARPTQKGIDVAPKPKFCVGRDAHSAAVGDEGALRMRHTPCGCIAPRISDAESMVPARADVGIGPYGRARVARREKCF